MGCGCAICQAIDKACIRLLEAGICLTNKDAKHAIKNVIPCSINAPLSEEQLKTLYRLGSEHGATLYRVLLARKAAP